MALVVRAPWTPAPDIVGAFSSARLTYVLLILDSTYPLGGYPVTPGRLGLTTRLLAFVPSATAIGVGNYVPVYDPANGTVRLLNRVAGAWSEVVAGTDLSNTELDTALLGW